MTTHLKKTRRELLATALTSTLFTTSLTALLASFGIFSMLGLQGCYSSANDLADQLNVYADQYEDLGRRDTSSISGNSGKKASEARHALEVMGSYRRAQAPQPVYPVVQPAEVRLMWVPDHLNRFGDLVPAHYYYLRVLNDRWAVQDAFDLERQLEDGGHLGVERSVPQAGGPGALPASPDAGFGTSTPWVYKDDKK